MTLRIKKRLSKRNKKQFPASAERGMLVWAPHSSSLLTASASAAIVAKKRTGMGTLDTLGSAPRSNNSFRVFKRMRCLVRQTHTQIKLHKKYTNKNRVIRTEKWALEKRELTRLSWLPFCVQSPVCQSTEESLCDSALLLNAAFLPLWPGCYSCWRSGPSQRSVVGSLLCLCPAADRRQRWVQRSLLKDIPLCFIPELFLLL